MPSLTPKAIEEFKKFYKEDYGEDLPDSIATEVAHRLARFVEITYKPIPKDKEAEYNRLEKETIEYQAQMKESDKRDFVQHLVKDVGYSQWRGIISPYKRQFIHFPYRYPFKLSDGQTVGIPTYAMQFKAWAGAPPRQFINYYFRLFLGANPFGHSARRISDFYAGLVGDFQDTQSWKKLRITEHDHNPVHDAMGNLEAFERILQGER